MTGGASSAPSPEPTVLDGTAIVVGEAGILIRGASGAGKSTLAHDLIQDAGRAGGFARLIADDRVTVTALNGRVLVSPVPATAGLIEVRGIGIVALDYEPAAVLRLVVDLDEASARLPERTDQVATILGVAIPRIAVNAALALRVTTWRLRCHDDALVTAC